MINRSRTVFWTYPSQSPYTPWNPIPLHGQSYPGRKRGSGWWVGLWGGGGEGTATLSAAPSLNGGVGVGCWCQLKLSQEFRHSSASCLGLYIRALPRISKTVRKAHGISSDQLPRPIARCLGSYSSSSSSSSSSVPFLLFKLTNRRMITSQVWTDDCKLLLEFNYRHSSHAGRPHVIHLILPMLLPG